MVVEYKSDRKFGCWHESSTNLDSIDLDHLVLSWAWWELAGELDDEVNESITDWSALAKAAEDLVALRIDACPGPLSVDQRIVETLENAATNIRSHTETLRQLRKELAGTRDEREQEPFRMCESAADRIAYCALQVRKVAGL